MKKYLLILTWAFLTFQTFSQPNRYAATVFPEVDTLKAVEYTSAEWLNNPISLLSDYNIHDGEAKTENRPLLMDIFLPHGDTLTKRPAIIFAHSGAFLKGSRLVDDMVALCDSFARRGYVTVTMDYRLGMGSTTTKIFGVVINVSVTPKNAIRAVYRGIQDGRAAIRFLKQNAVVYGIDSTKIYFVGSSAGGFIALHNVYFDEEAEIPPEALQEPSLGGLDAVGTNGFDGSADAVVSYWGAIQNPEIIQNNSTPVFLVHGEADNMVPFKKGLPLQGSVPPNPLVSFKPPETYGSYCVDSVLTSQGILHEAYFVEGKKHEFYGCNTGDFPDEGPNEYWDTIVSKTSDFLFERFRPIASFETTINGLAVNLTNQSSEKYRTEWDFGDGNSSNEIQPTHIYSAPGEYTVRLITYNRNLAGNTTQKQIVVSKPDFVAGINSGSVKIYPNPVKSHLYLSGLKTPCEAAIFDISGRLQQFLKINEVGPIDASCLKNGIYILEIKSGTSVIYRKFTKTE